MDCLQTVSELYISSVLLPVNEPYQTYLVYASLFYVGKIALHFLWGMPDMPHSFGCEATDWL